MMRAIQVEQLELLKDSLVVIPALVSLHWQVVVQQMLGHELHMLSEYLGLLCLE